ncbi:MAG: aminotransferase class I/II-fold pyridoxal phosphate-dependent enzyme [Desulfobacter postgatei]|uniref:aminotransferase class I/II-fold pyridoxal phosphate-dependent enzyme n=1 Tax=Desulfobacter TaxID=2289 RepID=UPI000E89D702|nr:MULTISPECIES: aminotransferase class I/II-fold pyridoxal phosphate-dependent enzyme [Desulfobacter]MDQ1269399.1 alanine-synthesizing transaminase [Thermodesulfobacteriota bacterium]MBP9598553.1 aminotransferase class I/II-fold pyridoxal phosphate-dependent enzyme [Desulfobacter sp.]MDD4274989.1 aminotransferase class I/II-fold pyridoxal phosphate-dependent enzyme [Desulfobacter postgatei]HAR33314.1 aminotransferase [Desulfobacter sp.]HBT89117.1 aminotransferase [Desulfobacter sp.]
MEQDKIIRFASRMDYLPPYLFGMINKMKMEKRRNGDDVIDLGMGNPMDPTPDAVIEKLVNVAKDPKSHRYPESSGLPNLKKEIAKYYGRHYNITLDADKETYFTIGSKEGISHLCLAIMGPGDCVLVPAPAFPIHIYAAVIAGANVMRIPLEPEKGFLDRIITVCESCYPSPKVLMLNYPHNPTGVVTDKNFFKEVVKLAKRFKFMVINDFAYGKITYDGYVAPSFLEIEGAKDVGVEFGSFSKSYNMAGWRIGYCVGNEKIVEALGKIKGYFDYGIFSAIQVAGIIALRDCDDTIPGLVKIYENRRDVLCSGLERIGWDITRPKAGMFVWAKIPEPFNKMGSMEFAIQLMNNGNVAVAPGAGFSEEGEGYLRLALVENEERLRQAVRQMKKAMDQMKI